VLISPFQVIISRAQGEVRHASLVIRIALTVLSARLLFVSAAHGAIRCARPASASAEGPHARD
jgi:hypothetical protein